MNVLASRGLHWRDPGAAPDMAHGHGAGKSGVLRYGQKGRWAERGDPPMAYDLNPKHKGGPGIAMTIGDLRAGEPEQAPGLARLGGTRLVGLGGRCGWEGAFGTGC